MFVYGLDCRGDAHLVFYPMSKGMSSERWDTRNRRPLVRALPKFGLVVETQKNRGSRWDSRFQYADYGVLFTSDRWWLGATTYKL